VLVGLRGGQDFAGDVDGHATGRSCARVVGGVPMSGKCGHRRTNWRSAGSNHQMMKRLARESIFVLMSGQDVPDSRGPSRVDGSLDPELITRSGHIGRGVHFSKYVVARRRCDHPQPLQTAGDFGYPS